MAANVLLLSCGVDGSASVFLLRSAEYIPLMEQILRREASGHEVVVRRITADNGLAVTYKIPPWPEPVCRAVLGRVADGGIATGFAALCTLLGCLFTRLVGFAIPGQTLCLAALAAIVGLALGIAAQWIGRHWSGIVRQQALP
jgi:hypothetical protein